METKDLYPEEKLLYAIFSEPGEPKHFLSSAGRKIVNDVLTRFQEKNGARGMRVIHLRFGFIPRSDEERAKRPGGSDARSLVEVGLLFNVTRERIRQIETRTLRNLRHRVYSRELKDLLFGRRE